ncbi:hypothetical protein OR16_27522 [Cupriavidus basilensis OR16]|uniref:Lipopolysaccharide biosynthesis protein n=1 Tax=Cupriavidus basilensis OR16 TaxID=1127483 RepID=H1SBF1_9BURK|nr:hypothetical protein [Cupriavidus basilensis]EHP40119.1 hypothetical protein OR16_27522 [Cupriavidus basilensis OR16]
MSRFLASNNLSDNPTGIYLVRALQDSFLQKHVRVVLPYSKADLKYIGDIKSAVNPDILGFSISFTGSSPAEAAARVRMMGDFLKDTMLRQELLEIVHAKAAEFKVKKQEIDNQLILKKLQLDEVIGRLNALQGIADKYPAASRLGYRQFLSSDSDGSKFLSPVIQLVGAESEIVGLRAELVSLEREAAQNKLRGEFFSRAEVLGRLPKAGKTLLAEYSLLQKEVFDNVSLEDDSIRQVSNDVGVIAEQLQTKHLLNTRFVSGPTVADHRSGPNLFVLLFVSFFFLGRR